jgi:hypothetical protein
MNLPHSWTAALRIKPIKGNFQGLREGSRLLLSRRQIVHAGAAAGLVAAARPLCAATAVVAAPQPTPNPALLQRAKAALEARRGSLAFTDVIGIADFSKASREPRFYLAYMNNSMITSYHVAHGRGSDPGHSGWLERFSNEFGSEASSNGAYVTGEVYHGKYGRSLRLTGLDATNSNALDRAIVIHGAWYAEPKMAETTGKLGRSEGCFALSETNLQYVLHQLGPGRLLYADKI